MPFTETDIRIAAQNCTTAAATIWASLDSVFDAEQFNAIRWDIFQGQLLLIQETLALQAAANVEAAFPGTQQVQQAPVQQTQVPVPQAQQPQYQPPPAPSAPPPPPQQYQPQAPVQQAQQPQGQVPFGACPKCGGQCYDNRRDNDRRRQPTADAPNGYKLGPDFKCKNSACGGVVWPADSYDRKNLPQEPRR